MGEGFRGLPVAGGSDVDGDGIPDTAFAAMLASPANRDAAGQVFLVFGQATFGEMIDSADPTPRILAISGVQPQEHTGSEIWIDDVSGDGRSELLICRQDHSPTPDRTGAGALTIIRGEPTLRTLAAAQEPLDLSAVPPSLTATTLLGEETQDRFCMWVRTGDADGDGIADILVGADQAGIGSEHRGRAYLVLGGEHLFDAATHDLVGRADAEFALAGRLATVEPPDEAAEFHFGATVQLADLDANGRAELLVAAALNRAGGGLSPAAAPEPAHGSGGAPRGRVYIFWDDNLPPAPWPRALTLLSDTPPGSLTVLRGADANLAFGEELVGGLDFDDDAVADLFAGDLTGTAPEGRSSAGVGHVIYAPAGLKDRDIDLRTPASDLHTTRLYGPIPGAIGADTAMQGDFDGDGRDDLAVSSPHDAPFGRVNAGTLHVLFGRSGRWPAVIDLAAGAHPPTDQVRIVEINGARGNRAQDRGDTLAYSGAAGDLDGDGRDDIITNEMVGNGIAPDTIDVGNLLVISGAALTDTLFAGDFEPSPSSVIASRGDPARCAAINDKC